MKTNEKLGFFLCFLLLLVIQLVAWKDVVTRKNPIEFSVCVETGMVLDLVATGYAIGKPYSVLTASGQPVVNEGFMTMGGVGFFTVAVDPRIIPLGSVVFIDSLGVGLATDTGRLIRGMRIDICFTSMNDAMKFGKKTVKVMILRKGPQGK